MEIVNRHGKEYDEQASWIYCPKCTKTMNSKRKKFIYCFVGTIGNNVIVCEDCFKVLDNKKDVADEV